MKWTLTIEQSARLIELGVDAKMAGDSILTDEYNEQSESFRHPVFMLSDLLSILPKKITDRRKIFELRMGVCDRLGGGECWYIKYVNPFLDTDELDSFQSAEELCDAIYAEIVWLKENPELVWL